MFIEDRAESRLVSRSKEAAKQQKKKAHTAPIGVRSCDHEGTVEYPHGLSIVIQPEVVGMLPAASVGHWWRSAYRSPRNIFIDFRTHSQNRYRILPLEKVRLAGISRVLPNCQRSLILFTQEGASFSSGLNRLGGSSKGIHSAGLAASSRACALQFDQVRSNELAPHNSAV